MYRNETGKLSKKRWFDVSANKNWLLSAIFTLGERRAGPRDAISSDTTKKNRIVDGWLAAIFLQPRPVFPEVQTRDRVEHSSHSVWPMPESTGYGIVSLEKKNKRNVRVHSSRFEIDRTSLLQI